VAHHPDIARRVDLPRAVLAEHGAEIGDVIVKTLQLQEQDAQGLDFDFITTGHSVNFCVRLEAPARGRLTFASGPVNFELDLAELGRTPRRFYERPIDQFLEVFACPIEGLPQSLAFRFTAPAPAKPDTPYFVRVRQLDEAKAWTSPFYVSATGRAWSRDSISSKTASKLAPSRSSLLMNAIRGTP